MAKKQETKPVVQTSLVFEGDNVKEMNSFPSFKAIGVFKAEKNGYSSCILEISGDKITSIEVREPDLKAIAVDACKMDFMHEFVDSDI